MVSPIAQSSQKPIAIGCLCKYRTNSADPHLANFSLDSQNVDIARQTTAQIYGTADLPPVSCELARLFKVQPIFIAGTVIRCRPHGDSVPALYQLRSLTCLRRFPATARGGDPAGLERPPLCPLPAPSAQS